MNSEKLVDIQIKTLKIKANDYNKEDVRRAELFILQQIEQLDQCKTKIISDAVSEKYAFEEIFLD